MPLMSFARMSSPIDGNAADSSERLVNLFARKSEGVSPVVLYERKGLQPSLQAGSVAIDLGGPVRAVTSMGGHVYAVANGTVWKVFSGASPSNVGTVTDGPTRIAANTSQVAIVVGGTYYVCDGSTTASVSPGAVSSAVDVAYLDGYIVVAGSSAGRGDALQVSALDDANSFNALKFAFAEESADDLTGLVAAYGQLYAIGTETTQTFYNNGNPDFPFAPNKSTIIPFGCYAVETVAQCDAGVFWVRRDGAVVQAVGGSARIISPPNIQTALVLTGQFQNELGLGYCFTERGADFYAVRVYDSDNNSLTTLAYDTSTELWTERSSGLDGVNWYPTCTAERNGIEYFGCDTGNIATLDNIHNDVGVTFPVEAISVPLMQPRRFTLRKLEVYTSGNSNQATAPQISLQTSKDGRTWGPEKWRDMGITGQYFRRSAWHALGQFQRAQAKLRITDAVDRDIYGVFYE